MSNPISALPPDGQFVYVTDNGLTQQAARWQGQWRQTLTDGGWLVFSDTATWDTVSPVVTKPASPSALVAADAALKQAEVAVEAAETAAGS